MWMIGINIVVSLMIVRYADSEIDLDPFSEIGQLRSENMSLRIEVVELYDCFINSVS